MLRTFLLLYVTSVFRAVWGHVNTTETQVISYSFLINSFRIIISIYYVQDKRVKLTFP